MEMQASEGYWSVPSKLEYVWLLLRGENKSVCCSPLSRFCDVLAYNVYRIRSWRTLLTRPWVPGAYLKMGIFLFSHCSSNAVFGYMSCRQPQDLLASHNSVASQAPRLTLKTITSLEFFEVLTKFLSKYIFQNIYKYWFCQISLNFYPWFYFFSTINYKCLFWISSEYKMSPHPSLVFY